MKCDKQKLELYLFGDLEQTETDAVTKHLEECEICQKEYAELKEVIEFIAPDKSIALTPEEKADMLIKINRSFAPAQPVSGSNNISVLLKIAAAIVIFTLGFYTNSLLNPPPKDITQFENQTLASNIKQSSFKNYRLSSAGFKLIAKGKASLDSTNTN